MLAKLDILGPTVSFKIERHQNLKSNIGGIMTIFAFFMFLGAFFTFGSELYKRQTPAVIFNKEINKDAFNQLTPKNFLYTVYDQSSTKPYDDLDRIFTAFLDYSDWKGNGTYTLKRFYPEKCSVESLKKWEGSFKIPKQYYYCLPANTTFDIKGIFGAGEFTSVRLNMDFCKNNTDPEKGPLRSDCYSRDYIERNVTGRVQMHILIESIKVDNLNYDNPITTIGITDTITNSNTNSWSRLRLLFKNIEMNTDAGFLFQEWGKTVYNSLDTVLSESLYSLGTNTVFSHQFGNALYRDVYKRKYIKVQDVFALMGGFINGILIFLRLFVSYLTYPRLLDIFNSLYKFQPIEVEKESNVFIFIY